MIEEYRDRLDIPEGTPTITLREGGTPLVTSAWLSERHRRRGLAQGRGRQPDRLVQGPRHDGGAVGRRRRRAPRPWSAPRPATPRASMAAYAARAGIKPLVLVPQGKISAGKLAQAIVHGAQVIMVRGNFDDCLRLSRGLAEHYPVALVNSVNPMRLAGPEDRVVRDRRLPRRRPRRARAADRQRRQHLGVLAGLPRVRTQSGDATRRPVMRGWQAAGAAPLVQGAPVPDPETVASAIRIGNPASWDLAVAAADESGGKFRRSPTPRSSRAQRELASRDGVFVEPASAAGVAGPAARGLRGRALRRPAGRRHRDRPRPQGHRHRAVHLHRPRRHRRRRRRRRRRGRCRAGLA